ncbi:uncharacterized protein LOC111693664 [Trichogramma pretiosum]|uniref:uncharacterized protein LOC111693664 n=1 Tax=Trichogramma pretiosum TaxID=7493 RepID=UPI000C71A3DE|nr:uncharacterized protein LOC111693664 [Trichogramma pretiosum]
MSRNNVAVPAWLALMLLVAVATHQPCLASTDELLECRANLTAHLKNQTYLAERVQQSTYIFTGKIKTLQPGWIEVKVKRALKGLDASESSGSVRLAINGTCAKYIRNSYTGIFMGRLVGDDKDTADVKTTWMHFGPVPMTLANLDRLNAALKGKGTIFQLLRKRKRPTL